MSRVAPGPSAAERWRQMLALPFQPAIYRMVLRVYLPILFPLTGLLVWLGIRLDRALGLPSWPNPPWNWVALVAFEAGGLAWVAWCYAWLVHEGQGSPAPFLGRTGRLVTGGPYQLMRNPSVWGKLAGVLGVGLAARSPSFTGIVVPLLLIGSIAEKALRQEPVLHRLWPEEYAAYCRAVPRFLPRLRSVARVLAGRSVYER